MANRVQMRTVASVAAARDALWNRVQQVDDDEPLGDDIVLDTTDDDEPGDWS